MEGARRDQMPKTIPCIAEDSNYNIIINLYGRSDTTRSIDVISRSIPTERRISTETDHLDQQASKQDRIGITTKGHRKMWIQQNHDS